MVMCRSCFTSTPQILSSTLYLHSPPYGSVVGDTPSHSFVLKQQAQTQVYQKICSLSSRRVQLQPVQREGVRRGGVSEIPQSQLHKWLHPELFLGVRHACASVSHSQVSDRVAQRECNVHVPRATRHGSEERAHYIARWTAIDVDEDSSQGCAPDFWDSTT